MKNIIIWSVIFLLGILFIYSLSNVLGPFIFALVITYFLQPMVSRLERIKIPRSISTTIIIFSFFSVIGAFVIFIIPLVYLQFITVTHAAPLYLSALKDKIYPTLLEFGYNFDQQAIADKYSVNILRFVTNFFNNLWSSTIMVVNVVSLIFITPVITFYTLRDWPLIVRSIDRLIPATHYKTITTQIVKIDHVLSAYIRGQTQVCVLLGIFYSLALYSAGLPYSLFVGFITGILSFIPYIGFSIGFIIANFLSFYQFDSWTDKAIIILIFILGQVLESAIITPRLIGNNVRLHPVWILFAIFAGGGLFGFTGVLIAIPVAAVIGVLSRFLLECYFSSALYGTVTSNQK